jgi:hypothetical protein
MSQNVMIGEMISETSVYMPFNHMTWFLTKESFVEFSRREINRNLGETVLIISLGCFYSPDEY